MDAATLLSYEGHAPRYTSYPTAPHFVDSIDATAYGGWLERVPWGNPLSLYVHIPFCTSLCWFCGCQTQVANDYRQVRAYVAWLRREIELVVRRLQLGRPVAHLHFGGGTPTILTAEDFLSLCADIGRHFELTKRADFAVEIDPRTLQAAMAAALTEAGVNRVSLGVQDFDPGVQAAINRGQTFEQTETAVQVFRAAGIGAMSFDLLYGLPGQTTGSIIRTVDQAVSLRPDRISLFGYAHVPWMKRHQGQIDEAQLPNARDRLALYWAAKTQLTDAGFVSIGIDHFARLRDPLEVAARAGRLRRNFQGYTTDSSETLIGLGSSAISTLPQGYAQNASPLPDYRKAVAAGNLATARGLALSSEDRLRRDVIRELMCNLSVDLKDVARRYNADPAVLADSLASLKPMVDDRLVRVEGWRVEVPDEARPILRTVCTAFDSYLATGKARHSATI